ncbi:hydroxymethylbilane synthase [Kineococcus terrestris]|uniref:hydroxymethylbilane synthase n=1 Tax=Kineococcus terrestris TaxID=2044856 RepID=UPI0034DB73D3
MTTAATTASTGSTGAGVLRLGTRRSALATTQSGWVADLLRAAGHEVELVEVTTHGDVSREPLARIGGTGVFVSALRDALHARRVDLAVHSLKDLPTAPADGLVLAAVPEREDPRDVLVAAGGRTLAQLPRGARVGTGSPRRAALLRDLRPDLDVVAVRGNVDTRLRLVADGRVDAVVLAAAGLNRLGRLDEATDLLDPDVVVPAPGQGALAVECRAGDEAVLAALAPLDAPAARRAVAAERRVLAALEAGCSAPVGAHARVRGGELHLTVAVGAAPQDPDGVDGADVPGAGGAPAPLLRREVSAPAGTEEEAAALGERVARELLAGPLRGGLRPPAATAAPPQDHPQDATRPRQDTESGS